LALIEFVNCINALRSHHVTENKLVGTDADYGAVILKKIVDSLALLQPEYVCCEPEM